MQIIFESEGLTPSHSIGWSDRAVLLWGKIRRFYLVNFRPRYVEESLSRRVGTCDRTGACCNLMFPCPSMKWFENLPLCRIYKLRPRNCTVFPIDERDLRERDIMSPYEPCGYTFVRPGATRQEEEERKQPELVLHV